MKKNNRIDGDDKKLKFGIQLRSGWVSRIVERAVLCEKSGFDSVWWMDHIVGGSSLACWPELYTSLALIGSHTQKITIGSAVTDTLRRHPSAIAQACATISQVANGRLVLGLGAGEAMNLVPFGLRTEKAYSRLKEAIEVLRLLNLSNFNHHVNFEGNFYSLENAFIQVEPSYPVPIYLGAFGPKMISLAGEIADGWLPWSQTPDTYRTSLERISKSAEKAGRTLSSFDCCSINIANISSDKDESRKIALENARLMLSILPSHVKTLVPKLRNPDDSLSALNWMGPMESEAVSKARTTFAESIPEEIALGTAIYGSPENCIGAIEKLSNAGCRHFIFSIRGSDPDQVIRDFASDVLPYFK